MGSAGSAVPMWMPRRGVPQKMTESSEHFVKEYYLGMVKPLLRTDAVPSVFPDYPPHKQVEPVKQQLSPRKRAPLDAQPPAKRVRTETATDSISDHSRTHESIESHLEMTKRNRLNPSTSSEIRPASSR